MAMYNEITVEAELTNTEYMITKNYNLLENKPQINSVELIGNKSLEDLGINPDAEENIIDTVKVNGVALTPDANKAVDVTITTGTNNGTVNVNGTDVNVKGLKSAAYTESSAYDVSGAAATVQGNVDALAVVVNGKVDKVQGKGLSQNDYTNADKTKLAGIQAGAQVNTVTGVKGDSESTYRTGDINMTKANIGLGNVDNTSDTDKPISTATQTALDNKVDKVAGKGLSTEDYTTAEKTKLEGISAEANKVEITPVVTEGTTLATISIDGVDTDIKGSDIDVDSAMSPTSENPVQNKVITGALNDKANKIDSDSISGALLTPEFDENEPYVYRQSCGGKSNLAPIMKENLIGASVVWNQKVRLKGSSGYPINGITATQTDGIISLSGTATMTYSAIFTNVTPVSTHIYAFLTQIVANPNNVSAQIKFLNAQITGGYTCNIGESQLLKVSYATSNNFGLASLSAVDYTGFKFYANVIDLTAMLGSTIADYVYSLEQATTGSGVSWFRKYFPEVYYGYSAPTIQSTKVSAKVVKDSNNTTIATYDLSGSHVVNRKYEYRTYESGDESLPDTITDGTNTVTKRTTPITETVTNPTLYGIWKLDANNNLYFDGDSVSDIPNPEIVENGGTEEFIDEEVQAGNRDVSMPCGGNRKYRQAVSVPALPTSGGKVELTYDTTTGQFSWE